MIELVLTINDKDGSYTEHAGVVLASVFSNTQQTINVHIVHDTSLSEENKGKLSQLVDLFHHNIFFYHITIPGDMYEIASGVHKIDYWTIASMYRLLLPLFIQTDRVIYLDCDILVNMDINELWSIDLGERYLGAVLDQGQNLLEYFTSLGLCAELYFNSGVILFHLDNIRNKQTWYEEMLHFLRSYPTMTMPDQDVLNSVYSSNYLQMDQRFNTFAHAELELENKIVHFAGDNKWWDIDSPAAPLYAKFLAMTPWARELASEPVYEPEQANIPPEPPVSEIQPVVIQLPENPVVEAVAPAPQNISVKPHRWKRRRSLRLRIRRRLRLRKKRMIRAKYRSIKRLELIKRLHVKKKKALQMRMKKLGLVKKKSKHVMKKVPPKKSTYHLKRTS
ncbi:MULTISPECIES: glycosyltransferase [unclassified Paenibacillus]|uniref:glycosyltransferase family 8 protein n=1 Tax=unclassified Paenibacillus TaxID=185978 RepID=UPI002405D7E8|nr:MULTISPECIES: glycosyltransferase [unclassified Paenibacillus]MDF9839788.1 lipopolysaccharide biosynthesis glycosyltransferase [Paenibacillus sp. PastF-2]MDF9846369.1 lipopolysaccharide biosynthesis glycosyltransferase [Paenibacillus sp. PastM-2]MDF9853282.1 lipopolysaccharide biosynthesis glycosyltransferase [Paenibacillus sp. PastF-1]MDH6506287.1 lipopolysaccharide biosynthesis glycosyltransferase [Paenibacillus sp. PastM-3]